MKHLQAPLRLAGNFLLLSCGVLGALFCPLTALNLPYETETLVIGILLLCLLTCLWNQLFRRQWPLLLLALGAEVLTVWQLGDSLRLTVLQLASAALDAWRPTYLWLGTFFWEPSDSATAQEAAVVYLLLAVIFAVLLGRFVLHQHTVSAAFLLTLPSLLISMFGEDAAPAPWALFLLLCFWLGALLTRDLRKNRDTRSLMAALLLPCAALIFVAGLYFALSPDTYSRPAGATEVQRTLTQTMSELSEMTWDDFTEAANADDASQQMTDIHLDELDGGSASSAVMLRVSSSFTGQIYLRGYSLLDYSDNTWSIGTAGRDYAAYFAQYSEAEATDSVEVRAVQDASGILYTVYGLCGDLPEGAALLGDYAISRDGSTWSLDVSGQMRSTGSTVYADSIWNSTDCLQIGMSAEDLEILTALAQEAAAGLESSATVEDVAEAVAAYVAGSAVYDLDTPANPDGTDFVLYFLQESHQGYCVHFASATTLLLRALGIPARYVTGYTVTITETDTWTDVTAADAHAWVEYFDGSVWVPLESTPGQSGPTIPESAAETGDTGTEQAEPETQDASDTAQADSDETASGQTDSAMEAEAETIDGAAGSGTGEQETDTGNSLSPLLFWLVIPVLAAILILRRQYILRRRQKRFSDPNPGRAFVAMWKYLLTLERRGIVPDSSMISLAEKARFSREGATVEDCRMLEMWTQAKVRALYRRSSCVKRLVLRYIFVV